MSIIIRNPPNTPFFYVDVIERNGTVTALERAKRPRMLDPVYLAWLRCQPCACGCKKPPPCDAAHLRSSSLWYDKPMTGRMKPDDKWALPLKHAHHMAQHDHGDELGWWKAHRVKDPFALCLKYYARYRKENPDAPLPAPRARRAVKPRRPRAQRQKLKGRATSWPKRKIPTRVKTGSRAIKSSRSSGFIRPTRRSKLSPK